MPPKKIAPVAVNYRINKESGKVVLSSWSRSTASSVVGSKTGTRSVKKQTEEWYGRVKMPVPETYQESKSRILSVVREDPDGCIVVETELGQVSLNPGLRYKNSNYRNQTWEEIQTILKTL